MCNMCIIIECKLLLRSLKPTNSQKYCYRGPDLNSGSMTTTLNLHSLFSAIIKNKGLRIKKEYLAEASAYEHQCCYHHITTALKLQEFNQNSQTIISSSGPKLTTVTTL